MLHANGSTNIVSLPNDNVIGTSGGQQETVRYLGCNEDDVNIFPEVHSIVFEDTQQEAMGQAQGCSRLHGCQNTGI